MVDILKSSPDWADVYKEDFTIWDPDGWDRSEDNFEASWMEPITRDEFLDRVSRSTCKYNRSTCKYKK